MADCMFCGGGESKEHIVSEWMRRDCDLSNTKFRMGFGMENSQGGMDSVTQPQHLSTFYTTNVCETCNNEWMSQLENEVKPILHPFLQTTWPANDTDLFRSLFVHSGLIARWLLKTACTFGAKMLVEVPEPIRRSLYQDLVPVGISVDMAYNKQFGLYMGMSRQWNVWKDEKLGTMHVEKQSFRLTWQVRHLAMRVSYFPQCEKNMTKPRFPVRIYPKFGISPDYVEDGIAKRSFYYETLEQMEHDTVYVHRGVDDPAHPNSKHRRLLVRAN